MGRLRRPCSSARSRCARRLTRERWRFCHQSGEVPFNFQAEWLGCRRGADDDASLSERKSAKGLRESDELAVASKEISGCELLIRARGCCPLFEPAPQVSPLGSGTGAPPPLRDGRLPWPRTMMEKTSMGIVCNPDRWSGSGHVLHAAPFATSRFCVAKHAPRRDGRLPSIRVTGRPAHEVDPASSCAPG